MTDKSKYFGEKIILKYESSIGVLEFRYISYRDIAFFQKLDKNITNKDFSVKAIFNQLETKKVFAEFSSLPESELKEITVKYVNKSKLINYYYTQIESPDVFLKFKKSILLYLEEQRRRMEAMSKAISIQMTSITETIRKAITVPMITLPKIIFPQIVLPKIILPDISKQLNILNTSFLRVFQDQSKIWQNFAVQHKKVSKKSLKNLKKYNWFINSSMPSSFIAETAKANNAKDMKDLFISYHTYNNFSTLNYYCIEWNKKPLFKRRMKILRDAINLFIKNYDNKNVNINNIIIPVLINQIEGIKHDYMKSKGFVNISMTSYKDSSNNQSVSWTTIVQDSLKNEDDFSKLIGTVFEKILFQKEADKATIINFSRHKISHGAIVKYGTFETTVRCFMILEFLSELK